MKELPLLFSTDMAQALTDDLKTQTRRLRGLDRINESPDSWEFLCLRLDNQADWTPRAIFRHLATGEEVAIRSPYGGQGDRLWVRETYQAFIPGTETPVEKVTPWPNAQMCWLADEADRLARHGGAAYTGTWRPSIHMPRPASRLLLENTGLRIQRLHDIGEADAIAEGVESCIADLARFGARARGMKLYRDYLRKGNSLTEQQATGFSEAKPSFLSLFASLNGQATANPYVWAVGLKLLENKTADRAGARKEAARVG